METWKQIPGYDGYYEVSDLGNVRSMPRDVSNNRGGIRYMPEQELVQHTSPASKGGYRYVTLYRDGQKKNVYVHLAVLEVFVGPRPASNMQGCHGDGDPSNNRLSNLRWDTVKNNAADRITHGTQVRGEASAAATITESQVHEIRRRAATESRKVIAADFGISRQQVDRIVNRQCWQHI